jgi:hypothetical protein
MRLLFWRVEFQRPEPLPLASPPSRHCEEPLGDEAIQSFSTVLAALDRHAAKRRLAMTGRIFGRLV